MSSRSGQHKDERNVLAHADSIENADSVIGTEHRRIHLAEYYTYSSVLGLNPAGTHGVRIINLDGGLLPIHMKFRTSVSGVVSAEYVIRLYEDATFVLLGEEVLGFNHNRRLIDTPADVFFDNAAIFSSGTLLFEKVQPAGLEFSSKEWIMDLISAPAGDAFVQITNLNVATGFTSAINIDYYQGDGSESSPQ